MKTIEKTHTIYQAFDGTEFPNYEECQNYEVEKSKDVRVNLRNFEIEFPMQDNFTYCRAYLLQSENEFEMLKAYLFKEGYDIDDYCSDYEGNGWYVVQGDYGGYARLFKLSDIIKDWNATLSEIVDKTMNFKGV